MAKGRLDIECGATTNTHKHQEEIGFSYNVFFAATKLLAKQGASNDLSKLAG